VFKTDVYFPIDLNHDGKTDFSFYLSGGSSSLALGVSSRGADQNKEIVVGVRGYAAALPAGANIGPARPWSRRSFFLMASASHIFLTSQTVWRGYWANGGKGLRNRYLGVTFPINGKWHFGWARVTVTTDPGDLLPFTATLTGYAYETIPGKAIHAGQTKEVCAAGAGCGSYLDGSTTTPDSANQTHPDAFVAESIADTPQPTSLGMLALGAQGILWRRKETALVGE
jgi:hypothetical protein